MPISIEKLREAEVPLADRILAFLSRSPQQAFSKSEIVAALEGIEESNVPLFLLATSTAPGGLFAQYGKALGELQGAQKIRGATVAGVDYYAART